MKDYYKQLDIVLSYKIQKGNKNIKNLKNIAWDIFHIINMSESFDKTIYDTNETYDICIPLFFTADENLNEIRNLLSLEMVAIKSGQPPNLFHRNDFIDNLSDEDQYMFFSDVKTFPRREKYNRENIKQVICKLEKEIVAI